MINEEQFGRLMACVERTHEDVRAIRENQVRAWQRMEKLSETDAEQGAVLAKHSVWIKLVAGVFGSLGALIATAAGYSQVGEVLKQLGGP